MRAKEILAMAFAASPAFRDADRAPLGAFWGSRMTVVLQHGIGGPEGV